MLRYCAFCRSERLVYRKRRSSLVDVAGSALAAAALSFIVWQELDLRALGFFAIGVGASELFIGARWRMSLPCPHCGFDPLLYKKHPEEAATRVKQRLDERKLDPAAWLRPLKGLPPARRKKASKSIAPAAAVLPSAAVADLKKPGAVVAGRAAPQKSGELSRQAASVSKPGEKNASPNA